MGKTLGIVLKTIGAAVLAPIAPPLGAALAASAFADIATSAAALVGLGPSQPKPETTETAVKTSRPPRVTATGGPSRLYGAYALYETSQNGTAVDVYAVHDGSMAEPSFYLGDESVTLTGNAVNEGEDGRYDDAAVHLYWTTGAPTETAFAAVTSLIPEWDSNHRGDGLVALALTAKSVKADDFQEIYPQTSVPVPSVVAKWNTYPDPAAADPLDEDGWTWTANPVRILLWYKLKFERVDFDTKIAPTLDYWVTAASVCDEAVPLKAGGTEPRYRSCVTFKHTDAHGAVVGALLSTFDGWVAPRADGALIIYAGQYQEPDPDDLIGPEEIVSFTWDGVGIDDDQAVNEIIVGYVSSEHDFNTVEGESWRDEADIADRGQVLAQPLDAQVQSFPQARRLAKRKQARIMAPGRGTITTNVAGRKIRGKRYIPVRLYEAGTLFYEGPVEVAAATRNMSTGGMTFSFVVADPNVDNWNPATDEGEPAAKGNRVAFVPLEMPSITSGSFEDGRLTLDVSGPTRDDLTWYVQTREQGAAVWGPVMEWPDIDAGDPIVLQAPIGTPDAILEVQVAYQIGDGRNSEWSTTLVVNTAIAPASPNDIVAPSDFGSAPWALFGNVIAAPTLTLNATTAPDGSSTADRINLPASGGVGHFSIVAQPLSVTAAPRSFGVWLRGALGGEKAVVNATPDGVTYLKSSPAITSLTTDWQLVTFEGTPAAGTWYLQIGLDSRGGDNPAVPAQTIYAWDARSALL